MKRPPVFIVSFKQKSCHPDNIAHFCPDCQCGKTEPAFFCVTCCSLRGGPNVGFDSTRQLSLTLPSCRGSQTNAESSTPQTFLGRLGLRPAFGEKPHNLITASASARLRRIRYLRVLVATSPADPVGPRPAMTTSPVRFVRLLRARHEVPSPCSSDRRLQTSQPARSIATARYKRRVTLSVSFADWQPARR